MVRTVSGGKHIGLKEGLFGAIGVMSIEATPLARMGPPAEREYAVEPVGVEMRIPSPAVLVRHSPLTCSSRTTRSWLFLET